MTKTYIVEKTVVRELPEMERPTMPITMDEMEERGLWRQYDKKIAAYNEILSRQPTFTRGDNGFWKEGQIVPASELEITGTTEIVYTHDGVESIHYRRAYGSKEALSLMDEVDRKGGRTLYSYRHVNLVAIPKQKEGGLTKKPEDLIDDIIWHYCKGLRNHIEDEQAEKTKTIFSKFLIEWAIENAQYYLNQKSKP